MKRVALVEMTVDELVERFVAHALGQDEADLDNDIPKFTCLFWQMEAVEGELKSREGDQRRRLMDLYEHRNPQVRLSAAKPRWPWRRRRREPSFRSFVNRMHFRRQAMPE